ncbi:P2Y purinoceptor 3 [Latimeria chalumnae]|uniref:G-protein coupled receptors family 1 profile domain-containing protein n=1 Tax=Latimeria chalumnae TaxID=7897 RepID=H3AZT7_LATCH|nr:PREDICTED: P2Y purinoceptor 3-like [Latimeria chalumnae]|eukprot:XP_006002226.1 PREDICTED: P2Y purinoceptor 3-like [Latimeria chalumnae]
MEDQDVPADLDMQVDAANLTERGLCPLQEGYKHILLPITYSLVFLLGLVLNGTVIWLACCRIKSWTCTTIYLVNLAVADLFYVCSLPLLIANYAMRDRWPFGNIACKLVRFFFYTNLYGSILFLTCITVHRFLGVCYPLKSINYRTKKLATFGTSITWMVVAIELLPTFLYAHTATLGNRTVCYDLTNPRNFTNYFPYGITLTVLGFLLPFVIILICCCLMIRSLGRSTEVGDVGKTIRAKSIRTVLLLCVLFAICFVPFHITRTIYLVVRVYLIKDCRILQFVTVSYKVWRPVVSFNSCINPLLFLTDDKNKRLLLSEFRKNKVGPLSPNSNQTALGSSRNQDLNLRGIVPK